jgi:hypothetical protein
MKILIIGEYSGFGFNLKKGFENIGHDCTIIHEGDGWKNFKSDKDNYCFEYKTNFKIFNIEIKYSWIIYSLFQSLKFYFFKKKFKNKFDRILIINYEFVKLDYEIHLPKFSISDLNRVLKDNGKVYLSACGDDKTYVSYLKTTNNPLSKYYHKSKFLSNRLQRIENKIFQLIDGVIPVMYDYSIAYNTLLMGKIKIYKTIPLPLITPTNIEINKINSKIKIMYGKNRPSKGYKYINDAVKKLGVNYPNLIEVIKTNKLSYENYIKTLKNTDILIDQCYSHSYGMNAIIGMSMGKIVLSGNTYQNLKEFQVNDIPVINIIPDSEFIYNTLYNLIENPENLIKVKKSSKKFVDSFHNSSKIAQEYINLFLQ